MALVLALAGMLAFAASPARAGVNEDDAYQAELKVLTYNVWDLGGVRGDYTTERLTEICRRFSESGADGRDGWDVIFVQELWPQARGHVFDDCGYEFIADVEDYDNQPLHAVAVFFDWLGLKTKMDTGLRTLSRYPIVETKRLTYSVGGYLSRFFTDGEYAIRKSAMAAKVMHPSWGPVWTVNTHLVSAYKDEMYLAHRGIQLQELSDWIKAELSDSPVVLGGDFNFGPKMTEFATLKSYDPKFWEGLLPILFEGYTQAPNADDACTYCASQNVFVAERNPYAGDHKIDHLFVSPSFEVGGGHVVLNEKFAVIPKRSLWEKASDLFSGLFIDEANAAGEPAPKPVLKPMVNTSDHFGWESSVSLKTLPAIAQMPAEPTDIHDQIPRPNVTGLRP